MTGHANIMTPKTQYLICRPLIESLRGCGLDLSALFQKANISTETLQDPDAKINLCQRDALWQQALTTTADDNLGLHVGENLQIGTLSVLGYLVMCSTDLEQALLTIIRFKQLNTPDHLSLECQQGQFYLEFALAAAMQHDRQIVESTANRHLGL